MRLLIIGMVGALVMGACGNSDPATTVQPTVAPPSTTANAPSTSTAITSTTTTTAAEAETTNPSTTTEAPEPPRSIDDLELEFFEAASGFAQPVLMVTPPSDSRLFVVDQPGTIWVIADSDPQVFLDIEADVTFRGEQGLLGMAFHPDFATNNLFYVSYVDNAGDTVIESIAANGDAADTASRRKILEVEQPAGNHNGGMITFGPDGNLWIGLGDGGGANDQYGNGQRQDSLLASMLRITVGPGIDGYIIPSGNIEGEVWATGLRNPWRFTFDGDDLWIADVGQNLIEEVDVVDWNTGNPNFGWSIMEGSTCFESANCDQTGLVLPVYEYSHKEGCSVTGGVVYRGQAMPELSGQFLFADYCTGWLRSVDRSGNVREWFPEGTFGGAAGFGVDTAGEPYLLTATGSMFGLKSTE